MAYTEDEIAGAYAYYGVELLGVESQDVNGTLEDVIMSVIGSPPPGRYVSTMPALLVKNNKALDFRQLVERAKQNSECSAKLGYILEVTIAAMQELKGTKHFRDIEEKFRYLQKTLKPADSLTRWIPSGLESWIPEDLLPTDPYEQKWNVCAKLGLDSFKRHLKEYLIDA